MITDRDRKSFRSRRKYSKSCSDDWHRWRFWSAFRHFGTHFSESSRMSKSSWMMNPTRSHEMPSCSAIDLTEIRRSSKISSWIWSIISGVVTVLGGPGRGASQVEKSPRLNWATQFLTVAYDAACSPNVSVRMAWTFLPCRKRTWWQLASPCCWNRARRLTCFLSASVIRKDLQFGTWTYPLSDDTIDSVLWHRKVGRAKSLSAPPNISLGCSDNDYLLFWIFVRPFKYSHLKNKLTTARFTITLCLTQPTT